MKKKAYLISLCAAVLMCACSNGQGSESEYFSAERALESSTESTGVSDNKEQTPQVWKTFDEIYPTLTDDDMKVKNYANNREVWDNSAQAGKLIEAGQDTPPQNELRLGNYRFGYNGCEVIAGYNMLTLAGKSPDMPKLIFEFEENILVAKDGSFGSDPRKMYLMLDKAGAEYETLYTRAECDKALDDGKSLIFSFYTGTPYFSEIHTVCIIGGREKYVLNRYNTVSGRSEISGIDDITDDDRNVIIAYAVDID